MNDQLVTHYRAVCDAMQPYPYARLVVVSKHQPASVLIPLLEAGQRHFGENRVQEAAEKWPPLRARYPDIHLHLIGQLQRNKAAQAAALFDSIHSLDRIALADALAAANYRGQLLIQVNLADEPQKGGVAVADLPALLHHSQHVCGLQVAGLMTVPPVGDDPAPHFRQLAGLANAHQLPELSMGMSGDYQQALALGATYIRVGSAIFACSGRQTKE